MSEESTAFSVEYSKTASEDLDDIVGFIYAESGSARANSWLAGLTDLTNSLESFPRRFNLIPEIVPEGAEIRQAIYFSHRVVYRILDQTAKVEIIMIYHASRKPIEFEPNFK